MGMSWCFECGRVMHPADASQWSMCRRCNAQHRGEKHHKIRTINDLGADQRGRAARSSKLLGGSPSSQDHNLSDIVGSDD